MATRRWWVAVAGALWLAVLGGQAAGLRLTVEPAAHELKGRVLAATGNAGVRDVPVTLYGPNHRVLGKAVSNANGDFALPLRERVDLQVVAETADGRRAEAQVKAAQLGEAAKPAATVKPPEPKTLPAVKAPDAKAAPAAKPVAPKAVPPAGPAAKPAEPPKAAPKPPEPRPAGPAPAPVLSPADLEAAVDRAVVRQLAPLREELRQHDRRLWLRDLLGGLGYLAGLLGLWFFWRSRRPAAATAIAAAVPVDPPEPPAGS